MGLDMYAFITSEKPASSVDFKLENYGDLHYWRKHPNLHGWFADLYFEKGGKNPDFNCDNLALSEEDLDALEKNILANDLPETSGFFFGASEGSEKEDDLAFIAKARDAIKNGMTVVYSAWW